jgi:3',5'-cyclic AMP phosphodiesterase CpdA
VRLAHCSDLHLLSLDGARLLDFANKRWIGGLNLLTNRGRHYHTEAFETMVADFTEAGVDHVICTGDVTNLAFAQEFRYARERFDRIALGAREVTVLPGNHDTYVAEGEQHFHEVFADYFASDDGWAWPGGEPWPVVRVRGDLALIGLSTSRKTPWFTAYGVCDADQLERCAARPASSRSITRPPAVARSRGSAACAITPRSPR